MLRGARQSGPALTLESVKSFICTLSVVCGIFAALIGTICLLGPVAVIAIPVALGLVNLITFTR